MLELILMFLVLALMAKHGRKSRRRYTLRAVRTIPIIPLLTTADTLVVVGAVTGAADGQYRAMSHKAVWSLRDFTAGEGPVTVGYAHGDYSVTEIKEAIEITNSISLGDLVASREIAKRFVRIIGQFPGTSEAEVLNDGRPIKTRLNWPMPIGKALNVFAYNEGGAAFTTGAEVQATGTLWVKDY